MLVISRKVNEGIVVDGPAVVTVLGIAGGRVRLGITAPETTAILRSELHKEPKGGDDDPHAA